MEIRIGFTMVSGREGWQFPPIQYLRDIETGENTNMETLKATLQDVMTYAENKLSAFKVVSKDDAFIEALKAITNSTTQKTLPKE